MSETGNFTLETLMPSDMDVTEIDALEIVEDADNIQERIDTYDDLAEHNELTVRPDQELGRASIFDRVRGSGRKFMAGVLATAALLGAADASSAQSAKGVAKTDYLSIPKDVPAEKLAETRSNDVLDKYDLISPAELLDIDGYRNPNSAISCMEDFKEITYRRGADPGIVFYKKQAAKRGSTAVKVTFSMYDNQIWSSSDGFSESCAWYMKEQSVLTRLYKQQPSGKKVLVKQDVTAPNGVGTVRASGLTATLQYPGYTGNPTKRNPDPEKVRQTFYADTPIKKGDKYFVNYTLRGKATDDIRSHGHLSKSQKDALRPIKMSVFNPVKIK